VLKWTVFKRFVRKPVPFEQVMQKSTTAVQTVIKFIERRAFPCVGAKSALAKDGIRSVVAGDLRDGGYDAQILAALGRTADDASDVSDLRSTIVVFPLTPVLNEQLFERTLWARLQALHERDRHDFPWDPGFDSNPASDNFAMSLGGTAHFIVGMHPGASRIARRAPVAMLAFNGHAQFLRMKDEGKFDRVRDVVRNRDVAVQGSINPMLADHGTVSEAAQYSGRAVSSNWVCPFKPKA